MSETHRQHAIGLVQAYYAAFNRGDWDGMLAFLAEDVAHDLNQGSREIGRNEFAAFLQRMNDSYREQLRDVVVIASYDGTRVGAEYVVHGVYHTTDEGLPEATGQTYVLVGGAFFDVQGDKITRVTNYYNLQEWIAQVSR
ncbi:ketosteroid isomerase-related protein [Xanthomonas citri]|uniref:ketosteroid isomerase-related protein n=1 Tax=Xanthomonas citri TaxID=346 RepID=UPI001C04A3AD|nr:ketosteroid isomerase-related protein [Xanthomonas citri]QWN06394.1 isopropylmalate/homocitrate/citramalate synthase [Xanthomonas citri pv. fuscans]